MKQFFKMFFASMLAMIVSGVIIVALVIGASVALVSSSLSSDTNVSVNDNSVLVIDLGKQIHEQSEINSLSILNNEDPYSAGLYYALNGIENAKKDDKIKGILIKMSPSPNGWATLSQLHSAIQDFRTSGKFVYAYGEQVSQGAYFVASAADSVFLNPMGDMELKGFATVLAFFKGTLEKLEVQPEIFYAGKFKSATEPFRADKISEPNREQIAAFHKGFWSEFATAVAAHAQTDTATINQLAATGAIQFPADALKYKLVDNLLYWDQVEDQLKSKTNTKGDETIKYISLDEYAEQTRKKRKMNDDRVAILFAEGNIVDGKSNRDYEIASETLTESIRKVRDNKKIKAVVLRVNSPGGSALASEVILRELQLLQKKKPLVISMGDLAASGGYYISCQADSIFALPNTITGSIGVFSVLFNTENLMKNKLGVTFDEVKTAPYADFPTVTRPLNADETQRMQNSVNNIYETFKGRVATGRKLDAAIVDSIAQGRVWTGTDALRIGLVDALGDLNRATTSASKLAKLKDYQVVTYPEPIDKFESMLKRFKGTSVSEAAIKAMLETDMGSDYEFYKEVKNLRNMNGKTMMAMPFKMNVQ
jgi:protease IV